MRPPRRHRPRRPCAPGSRGLLNATEARGPELVRALGRLTAEQREVVALRFVADLPIDAVAALTGRKANAVKALQHRALEALAGYLGAERDCPPSPGDRAVAS